jgi:small-conductance mechanosensitive channel
MEIRYWHTVAAAAVVGLITGWIVIKILQLISRRKDRTIFRIIHRSITSVLYFFFPIVLINIVSTNRYADPEEARLVYNLSKVALIAVGAWLAIRIVIIFERLILDQLDLNKSNNNQERRLFTKVKFIKRMIIILILIISFSLFLLSFQRGREIGLGILTSAGIVSVIVGFAAQKSISNLLAGIQIAFTQPIKIEDVVIVEGEWGRIEEINLTYVIVKTWDLRRMVLPITYFIENPFQNWTRNDSSVIGSVFLNLGYHTPVEKLREHFKKIIADNPLWDGITSALQVTDTRDQYIVIRMIMSARNAGEAFDLRCEIRESMINFIQAHFPEALPSFPISQIKSGPSSNEPL